MKKNLMFAISLMIAGAAYAQTEVNDTVKYSTAENYVVCECPDTENVYDDDQGKSLLKFINKSLRYPIIAQKAGVSGNVFVTYVVNEEGRVIDVTPIGFNGHKPTETKSIAEVALESEMQKRHMSEKKQLEYLQAVRALVSEAVRVTYSMPKSLRPATKNGKPVCRRCAMPYTFRL
jgi:hypothetical protein